MKKPTTYETHEISVSPKRRVHCAIKGKTPLLMNIFKDGNNGKRDITPEQACEESIYRFKNEIVQPGVHIEKAMEKMAANVTWEGHGKKTYKDLVKAFVTVDPPFIKHKNPEWEVYSCPVVIKATKGRIMRHRPMFTDWELEFDLIVKNPELKMKHLEGILRAAGEFNGLGDNRPKFGQFEVTKFEEA